MSVCNICKAQVDPNDSYCDSCGSKLDPAGNPNAGTLFSLGARSDMRSLFPPGSKSNDQLPIQSSIDEVFIKTYHCTTLKQSWFSPRAEGYITITNKRVIFHGYGGSSKLVSEVPIETTSGVSTYLGSGWRIPFIILGIVCVMCGFSSLGLAMFHKALFLIPLLFFAAAGFFFWNSRVQSYFLSLYSTGANGTPISIGQGNVANIINSVTGQGALFSVRAEPTEDTIKVMTEIGAIVLDLKTMGNHAIPKWLPGWVQNTNINKASNVDEQKRLANMSSTDERYFE